MDANRFDTVTKLFASRRLSRRQAVTASAAAGLATAGFGYANAQVATPAATPEASPAVADGNYEKIMYLFVQSFQSGSLAANTDGATHTLTLKQGLGQTIYFGDRPSRDVGATPTEQFLETLGFSEQNPPNAALIIETEDGETDLAVLELFEPTYDVTTRTATYQVKGLEAWEDKLELGLQDTPSDLSGFAPDFASAHLLIDDCANGEVTCVNSRTGVPVYTYTNLGFCYNYAVCMPCDPYGHTQPDRCSTSAWWDQQVEQAFPEECDGGCYCDFNGSLFLGC